MTFNRRKFLGTTMAVFAMLASPFAAAEPGKWSDDPVRIVVTFPPGGTSDLVARLLAKHLGEDFGQKAVVDNRPGAAGTVAADFVAKQPNDGTTLLLANNAPFTIAPTRFKSIPFDPRTDFTHLAYIGASAPGLFVQPSSGITNLKEYIAKVKDGSLTYGSSGVGSISHILGEAVDAALDVKSIHVPYKGSAPAIQDFRAKVLDTFYDMAVQNSDLIENKEAIAIAIASPERNPQLPDLPTFKEQGYDVVIENWVGVSGPSGIDAAKAKQINETINAVFASEAVQKRLTELGITNRPMSVEGYTALVGELIDVWAPLIKSTGIAEK